jgi:hypothetical protein
MLNFLRLVHAEARRGRSTILYSGNLKGKCIVVELKEVGFEGVACIHLSQDFRLEIS